MDSVNASMNFLQILDDAVNDSLEQAAEKKGITVQELIGIFQKSEYQKANDGNQIKLEIIHKSPEEATIMNENKVDNEHRKQEHLVIH